MEKEKLMKEYEATLESLVEKTRFVYSEKFYSLDEFEKQKYQKDKMATEGHLNTLSSLLWSKSPSLGGLSDIFVLGILSSIFSGSGFSGFSSPTATGSDATNIGVGRREHVDVIG